MKTVLLLLLISNIAFAITGMDNWESIRQTPGLILVQPHFAQAFGPKGLFNACATDEQFRNINPVKTCALNKIDSCLEHSVQSVTVERLFNRKICSEQTEGQQYEECMTYETSLSSYPKSFFIPVMEKDSRGQKRLLFSKKYSLPECE